jgi:MFS transporter, FHS family, L-fucose permease
MMIMGGGIVSFTQGALSDYLPNGIQNSYWVGVACFAYLAWYAFKTKSLLRTQGIEFKTSSAKAGH